MKYIIKKILPLLVLFFSFSLFAKNEPIPEHLGEKIIALQEMLQSGNEQSFFEEIGYPDYVKDLYLDYTPEGKNELIADDKNRIKKIFTHLLFNPKTNSFPKICFGINNTEQDERTKECQSVFWDGKQLLIFNSGKSFDNSAPNEEAFEFSSTIIFKFSPPKNYFKIVEIRVAG